MASPVDKRPLEWPPAAATSVLIEEDPLPASAEDAKALFEKFQALPPAEQLRMQNLIEESKKPPFEKQLERALERLPTLLPLISPFFPRLDYPQLEIKVDLLEFLKGELTVEWETFLANRSDLLECLEAVRQFFMGDIFAKEREICQIVQKAPPLSVQFVFLKIPSNHRLRKKIEFSTSLAEATMPQERMKAFHRHLQKIIDNKSVDNLVYALHRLEKDVRGTHTLHYPTFSVDVMTALSDIFDKKAMKREDAEIAMWSIYRLRGEVRELVVYSPDLAKIPFAQNPPRQFENPFALLVFSYVLGLSFPRPSLLSRAFDIYNLEETHLRNWEQALLPALKQIAPNIDSVWDFSALYEACLRYK